MRFRYLYRFYPSFGNILVSAGQEVLDDTDGFIFPVSQRDIRFHGAQDLGRGEDTALKPPAESVMCSQFLRLSSSMVLAETEPKTTPERKLLKVAIIGRPNAGKSTLINKILKLNVCGVSHKSHTTRMVFTASFTENDTQIIFLDTPGLITAKEFSRFKLSSNFLQASSRKVIDEVDMIGIIHEVREPRHLFKFPLALVQNVNNLSESKPLFLVLNKVDLVIDKSALMAAMDSFRTAMRDEKQPKFLQKFSQVFFTSAIQNKGVREIVDYLLQQAKPGAWLFETDKVHNAPLVTLILELLRANFMDNFPQEIPYYCKYEIEYLKENDLGEIICVGLITCRYAKHVALITSKKRRNLRSLCKRLESDLFKIIGKVFRIRVVVQASEK